MANGNLCKHCGYVEARHTPRFQEDIRFLKQDSTFTCEGFTTDKAELVSHTRECVGVFGGMECKGECGSFAAALLRKTGFYDNPLPATFA
jgi:hypothetical protein